MFGLYAIDLLMFALKAVVIVVAICLPLVVIFALVSASKNSKKSTGEKGKLVYTDLHSAYEKRKKTIEDALEKMSPDRKLKKKALKSKAIVNDEQYSLSKKVAELENLGTTSDTTADTKAEVKAEEKATAPAATTEAKTEASTAEQSAAPAASASGADSAAGAADAGTASASAAGAAAAPGMSIEEEQIRKISALGGISSRQLKKLKSSPVFEAVLENDRPEKDKLKDTKLSESLTKLWPKLRERKVFLDKTKESLEQGEFCPRNLFVVEFRGSTNAKEHKLLRKYVDLILETADERDEVIVKLTSPGGLVNTYGLCASLLQRIRDRGIKLTVTVDEVAASGGYLMACVAHKIVAAPFAYVGSIGVIAGIPNFRKTLHRFDVEYEQVTAGKYKRTLSVLGENTEEGRKKFKEELEAVHKRFKELVLRYRPHLDAEKVTTGEHWLAIDAIEFGLVDEIATSDEYIAKRVACTYNSAIEISWQKIEQKSAIMRFLERGALKLFSFRKQELAENLKSEIGKIDDDNFLNIK